MANEYKPGQVWKDELTGELWIVKANGNLRWDQDLASDNGFPPSAIEVGYGPLTLVKDVPEELPMADWEKELLAQVAEERAKPMVFDLSEELAERLDRDFVNSAVATYDEALHVLLKKNADYGSKNIAESPGGALNGLRVRMWDKIARINNLIDSGAEPQNESLRDSFADLGNYALIAVMVLDGNWPGEEKDD